MSNNSSRRPRRVLWAYFSETAAENNGTVWWQTTDGQEVECTEFCKVADGQILHRDAKFVGKVTRFLRNGREPSGQFKTI